MNIGTVLNFRLISDTICSKKRFLNRKSKAYFKKEKNWMFVDYCTWTLHLHYVSLIFKSNTQVSVWIFSANKDIIHSRVLCLVKSFSGKKRCLLNSLLVVSNGHVSLSCIYFIIICSTLLFPCMCSDACNVNAIIQWIIRFSCFILPNVCVYFVWWPLHGSFVSVLNVDE